MMETRNRVEEEQIDVAVHELLQEYWESRTAAIKKCATKLEALGLSKASVCVELIHRLKGHMSERTIRRALGPEYKNPYPKDRKSANLANSEREEIEENAKAMAESLGLSEDAEPDEPTDGVIRRLQEKLKIALDERNYYRDQMVHYKTLAEAKKEISETEADNNEVVIYADMFDDILEMMKKSTNGIILQHDGYNVFRLEKLSSKKPYVAKRIEAEDVRL